MTYDTSQANKELIDKIISLFNRAPDRFYQGVWGVGDCETPCCIAGWAAKLQYPERAYTDHRQLDADAQRALGLSTELTRLIFAPRWPLDWLPSGRILGGLPTTTDAIWLLSQVKEGTLPIPTALQYRQRPGKGSATDQQPPPENVRQPKGKNDGEETTDPPPPTP